MIEISVFYCVFDDNRPWPIDRDLGAHLIDSTHPLVEDTASKLSCSPILRGTWSDWVGNNRSGGGGDGGGGGSAAAGST